MSLSLMPIIYFKQVWQASLESIAINTTQVFSYPGFTNT